MGTFFIIIISALVTLGGVTVVKSFKQKQLVNAQSTLLLNKIKKVCKFITVEGDFAEIYHYEDVKERFLKLVSSKKKALVVINAKAYLGYDLSKIELTSHVETKQITLNYFPQAELLSIETNLNYYDKKDGKVAFGSGNEITVSQGIDTLANALENSKSQFCDRLNGYQHAALSRV